MPYHTHRLQLDVAVRWSHHARRQQPACGRPANPNAPRAEFYLPQALLHSNASSAL